MANVNTVFDGMAYGQGQSLSSAVDIDRPSSVADCMYIDLLLSMPCYLNLSAFGVYGSSREVSVSIATLEAIQLNCTLLGGADDGEDDEEIGGSGASGGTLFCTIAMDDQLFQQQCQRPTLPTK